MSITKDNIATILADSQKKIELSKRFDAIFLPSIVVLIISSFALLGYWTTMGSGLSVMFPELHKLMVTGSYMLPGQSEHVQGLLNDQGYITLWQFREMTTSVSEDMGLVYR